VTASPPPAERPLRHSAAWAPVDLDVVTATGTDAVRFVDNFATADLSALAIGRGTEAFFADARGWVLALATVLRTDAGLTIFVSHGLGPMLRDHLERYHIREAVDLVDVSGDVATLIVAGPAAGEQLARLGVGSLPESADDHVSGPIAGVETRIVRLAGRGADGFWLHTARPQAERLAAWLTAAGLPAADSDNLEALRIEACVPSPADIVEKTLPQELGRDARAISFTKGCYLGQETVARLDAMGHVNRRLALVAIDAPEPPAVPAAVVLDDQPAGTLTSACVSPVFGRPVGLGLLHTRFLAADRLRVGAAAARVVAVAGRP
jgi:folate-binding protein YgfZ